MKPPTGQWFESLKRQGCGEGCGILSPGKMKGLDDRFFLLLKRLSCVEARPFAVEKIVWNIIPYLKHAFANEGSNDILITVAILAQVTPQADAAKQAFLHFLNSQGKS